MSNGKSGYIIPDLIRGIHLVSIKSTAIAGTRPVHYRKQEKNLES